MAEAGVPHPDGPRPEPRTPERPGRTRSGRDPVALAAWRRVAEQRRRSTDGPDGPYPDDDVPAAAVGDRPEPSGAPAHEDPHEDTAVPDAAEQAPVAVPEPARPEPGPPESEPTPSEPALPARSHPLDGAAVLRDPAAGAPREARPGRDGEVSGPPGTLPDDGPPAPGRLHEVLLGLAGRIDDDALTAVREMVAAEDDAEAAELLGGCLLADEVGLAPDERGVLAPWFATARVDPDLLAGLPVDPDALRRSGHRFVPAAAGTAPAAPLARAARRLPGVVSVRESWRVTPAGAAPGPVPHRVVLVETADPDDCDHVVHHLAHAARGLGDTSVEVFAAGLRLPAYHRDALAAARPLVTADPRPPRAPEVVREDGETWRTVADAGTAHLAGPPAVPARSAPDEEPVAEETVAEETVAEPAAAEPPVPVVGTTNGNRNGTQAGTEPTDGTGTSIDDDLSLTARRIAALWARPAPEDFSAPLPSESLEGTRLEPQPDHDAGSGPTDGPAAARYGHTDDVHDDDHPRDVTAGDDTVRYDDEWGDVEDVDDDVPAGPVGRHGRAPEVDPGTDAFPARTPRPAPRLNGHHLGDHPVPADDEALDVDPGDPTPPAGLPLDPEDDAAQVQRARHSRGRSDEPAQPARFGHDARYGAGPGPAWPGAPVTGDRPGSETLFTSPVEIGEEPVTLGTNGHRHDAVPIVADGPEAQEPATGPVSWAPVRPVNGVPLDDAAPPGPAGDVAPPWAAADGTGWPQDQVGRPPSPAPAAPGYRPPQPAAPAEATGGWPSDTDDSVAQLSDRERELLARLHEELAQRERAEGTDPFAGPTGRPQPPRPAPPSPDRRNGQGPPPGRTNGHGLPGGPDPTS